MAAADAPKKISGVHKRCWRYIPNLTKSTESAPSLTKSPETVPKTEAQVSWCISISNGCCLPNHSYSDILVWLMPSDFKFFSIGIVIFGCRLFPNQLFLDVFDAFCNIIESQTFGNANRNMFVISEKLELDGFSFLKFFLFLEYCLVVSSNMLIHQNLVGHFVCARDFQKIMFVHGWFRECWPVGLVIVKEWWEALCWEFISFLSSFPLKMCLVVSILNCLCLVLMSMFHNWEMLGTQVANC